MTEDEQKELADMIRGARQAKKLTAREVARRAGVDVGVITKLERREIGQPRVENVRAIALVLDIPLSDVYTTLHWLPQGELPTLRPYMRAKYGSLPDSAVDEVERLLQELTDRYGTGPRDHEDE